MSDSRASYTALVGRNALRLVLFGRPGAGKSSLLGALALAAADEATGWRLNDLSHGLTELAHRVRENNPQPTMTPEQVVPYPVVLECPPSSGSRGKKIEALFIDCDGSAALQLLEAERLTDPIRPPGRLADFVARADVLVLVVPAVEPAVEETFTQFARFLKLLEDERGQAIQVSGLPVLLALTKCDLLARPDQSFVKWIDCVQEQVQSLDQRFQHFREQQHVAPLSAFGQVHLQPAFGTAVQRAPLAGQPPEDRRPFGVNELFQQGLEQAARYRGNQRRSGRRLLYLAGLLLLVLAGMIGAGLAQSRLQNPLDRQILKTAIEQEAARYEQLRARGQALENFSDPLLQGGVGVPWTSWAKRIETLQAEVAAARPDPAETLPDAGLVKYEHVYQSEAVRQARRDWQSVEEKLRQRVNLASALGLIDATSERPPLLKIPPPPDFTAAQAQPLLERIAKTYPDAVDWTLDGLPRFVTLELTAALHASERNLLAAGQQAILGKLQEWSPEGKETPELWHKLRDWLKAPIELHAWRELARLVMRLSDPLAEDPVQVFFNFLNKGQHEVELQRLVLKVPDGLRVAPAGKLAIYHSVGSDVRTTLNFKRHGEPVADPDEKITRYVFVPDSGETLTYRLTYRPGNTLWADLPLKTSDKQDRLFTWSLCRSQMYQFERLVRPPRLHRADQQATDGDLILDAGLSISVGIVPRIPDLMPVVKLKQ
jgi:GTPase SAR1 family protein